MSKNASVWQLRTVDGRSFVLCGECGESTLAAGGEVDVFEAVELWTVTVNGSFTGRKSMIL